MPPDHREEARQWLARAQGSLVLARQPKPESAFWADLCYLSQQSAEKALKAVYHWIDRPHRFTHDLEELGRGLAEHGLGAPGGAAVALTRYAVETRYPGLRVTEEDYRRGIELASGRGSSASRIP